jgi:hypothetical protein
LIFASVHALNVLDDTADKMSGCQQLSGSNNLVVAGNQQKNWAPENVTDNRRVDPAKEQFVLPTQQPTREAVVSGRNVIAAYADRPPG